MNKIPELLAPGGTLDSFKTALLYGADVIYAGLPSFSMRARAKITSEEIKEGIDLTHKFGKKTYLAFNLFAHERDFVDFDKASKMISYLNPDALIVGDPGVLEFVKQNHPNIPVHISTQANITSSQSVKFWQKAGADLCVLAREVSFKEFKIIRQKCPDVGLEIFIHGAMCMAYSGRCMISAFLKNRNANKGACVQACRWNYRATIKEKESDEVLFLDEDERGTYIFNAKDLCLMPHLKEILTSGVDSLKIEGRNRSEYYTGSVVHYYRLAINNFIKDPDKFDYLPFMEKLNVLETRGYTDAFFNGVLSDNAFNYETTKSNSKYHNAGVIVDIKERCVIFELRNELKAGDILYFLIPNQKDEEILKLRKIINAKNDEILPKMSAGQKNSIKIPLDWFEHKNNLTNFIIAYKKKV